MDKKYFRTNKLPDLKHELSHSTEGSFQQGCKDQKTEVKKEN